MPQNRHRNRTFIPVATVLAAAIAGASPGAQQAQPAGPPAAGRQRTEIAMDPARARALYVSNDPADHARNTDFKADMTQKAAIDARYEKASAGVMDFRKVTYRSSVGDMDIPAYLFQPLTKRGPRGHAAMVWVHGGVHGNWGINMFPFVKEAVERGYVVICPEYRGSTGYGEAHHMAIDYGGYEVDDVRSAVDFLKTLPHVDQNRLGVMGWSHGGMITSLLLFDEKTPFKAGAAIVPVSAKTGRNIPELLAALRDALPEAPGMYPPDQLTDRDERFFAAELLREKIFQEMGQELPYRCEVVIDSFKEEGRLRRIEATILVERESQKPIVLGPGGERLKRMASAARKDMEKLFGGKVYLGTWVKVRKSWTDDARVLRQLGYE